jgi:plasmid stabilization system protein ParE
MASKFRHEWTERAADDLRKLVGYLVKELGNPSAASRFMNALEHELETLCAFPESGTRVNNEFLPNVPVRKTNLDQYIIYYLVDAEGEKIIVLRIVYGRRDLSEILRNLDHE